MQLGLMRDASSNARGPRAIPGGIFARTPCGIYDGCDPHLLLGRSQSGISGPTISFYTGPDRRIGCLWDY